MAGASQTGVATGYGTNLLDPGFGQPTARTGNAFGSGASARIPGGHETVLLKVEHHHSTRGSPGNGVHLADTTLVGPSAARAKINAARSGKADIGGYRSSRP